MSMTVVTLTKVPLSLRGDLTKWMQEISRGVYVGNFNSKIRTKLWSRIIKNIGNGQATISYAYQNEIGYKFATYQTPQQVINHEGIPLVLIPKHQFNAKSLQNGFSNASKFLKIKSISKKKAKTKMGLKRLPKYAVLDIETDGIETTNHRIIEVGAVKIENNKISSFDILVNYDRKLPTKIKELTGISDALLKEKGNSLKEVLYKLKLFIGDTILVGYNINFDIEFINYNLNLMDKSPLSNRSIDLLPLVKREKMFVENYKLETILPEYGIHKKVPHRALLDSKLINLLAPKVKDFELMLAHRK